MLLAKRITEFFENACSRLTAPPVLVTSDDFMVGGRRTVARRLMGERCL